MRSLFATALLAVSLAAGAQESVSEAMGADAEGRLCGTNRDEAKREDQLAACSRVINDPQKFAREDRELALQIRARTHRDLGRYDEAVRDFTTLIEIFHRESDAAKVGKLPNMYSSRAHAHWGNGDLAAAEADLTSAIIVSKRDIDRAGRYERRALFYARLQQPGKALSDFKEALKLDPNGSERGNSRLYVEEFEKRGIKATP